MNSSRLVSIGIPTYNRAGLVVQAIQSVRQQTYPHLEIIVSDDCSSDDTAARVSRIPEPRLLYHRTAGNLRPPRNWNECVRLAHGEYFALLPDDDVYYPEFIAEMVGCLEQQPEIAFVQCAYDVADLELRPLRAVLPAPDPLTLRGERALRWQFQGLHCLPATLVFRRAAMLAAGLWREDYWDDWAFILRLAYRLGFTYLPRRLAITRQHGQNLNRRLARELRDAIADLINQQADVFGAALPATSGLVALRARLDRQLSQHCLLSALGALRRGEPRLAWRRLQRAHQLYALAGADLGWLKLGWRIRREQRRAARARVAARSKPPLMTFALVP
ncbi:MAG: glycosyltransferase family 2 protein [Anaerolineales bacterium]|nr:glycosyltransferase family 2 protein [Anaerolineales bacterium]